MSILHKLLYRVDEDTTMANITYLPSGLGAVRSAIKTLARKKQDWNIEILENGDGRDVIFEDDFSIHVPKIYWKEFDSMFRESLGSGVVNLNGYLIEAMEDDTEELREELRPLLTGMFDSDSCRQLDRSVQQWRSRFGVRTYQKTNSLVRFEDKQRDIQKLTTKVFDVYGNDKGNLELLLTAIKNGDPLNSFQIFRQKDFLYGARVYSAYSKIPLIFEATVDMAHMLTQSITIDDQDVLDEIQGSRGVKVVKNVVYPVGESFNIRFFRELEDAIQGPSDVELDDDEVVDAEEGSGRQDTRMKIPRGER
jgi:hypothetical protein